MCDFFSFVTLGNGRAMYVPYKERIKRRTIAAKDPDSHSVICAYFGIRRDGVNCYEARMLGNGMVLFRVDSLGGRVERDVRQMESWFNGFCKTPEYRRMARLHADRRSVNALSLNMFGKALRPSRTALRKLIATSHHGKFLAKLSVEDWRWAFRQGHTYLVSSQFVQSMPLAIQKLALRRMPDTLMFAKFRLHPTIQRALVRKRMSAYCHLARRCKGLRALQMKQWGFL